MTAAEPRPEVEATLAREAARGSQSFSRGLIAGALTASAAAVAWAAITFFTEYQIGFMAIGVGVAVGLVVRAAGRGSDASFRALGAGLALAGCAAGNLLAACAFLARANDVGVARVLQVLDVPLMTSLMQSTFSPMDLLFYGIAIWEAWRLSVVAAPAASPSV